MISVSEIASYLLLGLAFPIAFLFSAFQPASEWPLRGIIQRAAFFGLILCIVLVTFGYRPFFHPDQDQVGYLPYVLRFLDSGFAAGDTALDTHQWEGGYVWVLALLTRLMGFDLALAALTISGIAISIFAVFSLGKAVGIQSGPPLAAFVTLAIFVTYGELGYRLALFHDRFVEVVPATFARAILIFAIAVLLSHRAGAGRLLGGIGLMVVALAFQQPVAIFVSAVALAAWAFTPLAKLVAREHEPSPRVIDAGRSNPQVVIGAIAILALTLREFGILEGVFDQISVLSIALALAVIFLLNGFSGGSNFSRVSFKNVVVRLAIAIGVVMGMLLALVATGGNGELSNPRISFGEQLESFDYVLSGLRSDLVSFGDAPNSSLLFLLLVGLVQCFVRPKLRVARSIGFLNMIIGWFFVGVFVSEMFALLPGIGGYSIWPLASSPVLSVLLTAILMVHLETKVGIKSFVILVLVLPAFRSFDADLLAFVASLVFLSGLALSAQDPHPRSIRKSLP